MRLFLTCCYGHPFKHEVLKKIEEARKMFPEKKISVEGGVSLDKLKTFRDPGINYVSGAKYSLRGIRKKIIMNL